jgi:PIN domain nuclease of toxin-antitoxin system
MRLILDTHTFIWLANEPELLSKEVHDLIAETENTLVLSVVSAWEMQIKVQIGKLDLGKPLADIISEQQEQNEIVILPISLAHALKIAELPLHHNDPFDRLLIAQALIEDMTLLSKDAVFEKYEAKVIW